MYWSYSAWSLYSLIFISFLGSVPKYDLPCDKALLDRSIDSSLTQVGVIEKSNNNDGKEIDKYLKAIGLNSGYSYCAAGIYWSFYVANYDNNKIPVPKTGSANAIFNYALKHGVKSNSSYKKGDLITWRAKSGWKGHIERIIKVGRKGWIETIGFNVKKGNKEGVFIKRRNIKHPLGRLKLRGIIGFKT